MRKNAIILNGSDQTRLYDVACDEGDITLYENLLKSHIGSTYLDTLNKGYYIKTADTGTYKDWSELHKATGKKCTVFAAEPNDFRLGKLASELQTGITIGSDDKVHGTLFKIKAFTEFSNIEEEQSGHYLNIHIPLSKDAELRKKQSIHVTLGSKGEKKLNPSPEGSYLVARVTPEDKQLVIKIKQEGDSGEANTLTRTLNLEGLTFME